MRVSWLQAVRHESLGAIECWLNAREFRVARVALWQGDALPEAGSFDALIMTGGGMFPTDEYHYPWLINGLSLIRSTVLSGRHFLGICLGAQLLGKAFGAVISQNPQKEFGWHAVQLSAQGADHPLMAGLPTSFSAFHWHEDVVSVPLGGMCLANSAACLNQAFAVGKHALGVQFHPEITEEKARTFVQVARPDLSGRYVQNKRAIFSDADRFNQQQALLDRLLKNLLGSDK